MTDHELKTLTSLIGHCSYNDANKTKFRSLALKLLRELAHELALSVSPHFNPGGIAVGGDASLHSDTIYVSVSADTDLGILFRTCRGTSDFTGGQNHWLQWTDLQDDGVRTLATRIQRLRARRTFNRMAGAA